MSSDSINIGDLEGTGSSAGVTTQPSAARCQSFSLSLIAYDDQTGDRTDMRVFAVESLKKMTASDTRLEAIRNADPETLPSRLPLKEELEFNAKHKDKTTVVWVGMLPTTNSLDEKTKMASSKGYSVSSARNIETIKTNPNAMRVVFSRGRAIAVYYALISQDPQTKLCNGIMTSLDSVFFFPEFRDDDATSVQKRKATWGAKVREACDRSDNVKRGTKRMHDETEFVVEDQRSVSAGMIVE